MIISTEQARELVSFPESWTDSKIQMKLRAIEQTVRAYTHNDFTDRDYKRTADIVGGSFVMDAPMPFVAGDTVQITETRLNKGLFTVAVADESVFSVLEAVQDEPSVLVTKVVYPADVVDCCVNLLEWEITNRDKVGVKSETLSRHSVTYEDSASMFLGYPLALLGCLKLYRKLRC